MAQSPVKGKYDQAIDSESAYEVLQKRMQVTAPPPAAPAGAPGGMAEVSSTKGFGAILGGIVAFLGGLFGTSRPRGTRLSTSYARAEALREMFELKEWWGMQIKFTCGQAPSIALNKDEEVLCYAPTTLVEPRAVRTWHSTYGGPSFRIAKGISFRAGASSGISESHEEMRSVDRGILVLTNERIIFVGSKRTIGLPVEKIIGIDDEGYFNSLRLNREGKQKAEVFQFDSTLQIEYDYKGKNHSAPFHVAWLIAAINQILLFRQHPEFSKESRRAKFRKLLAEAEELARRGLRSPLTIPSPQYYELDPAWLEKTSDEPNPIVLCITCRSKDISEERGEGRSFICNECGTILQQVGDKYKLVRTPDVDSLVWQRYGGKTLFGREWSNIANDGLSDDEIIANRASQSEVGRVT
jgi:helicase HerA-like protein